jgi:hypothetical protein
MAGRKPLKQAADKASTLLDSNGPIGSHINGFIDGRKNDWKMAKGIGATYAEQGKNIGKTADKFLKDFGGGSFGKGAAKMGGYALGGAMLYDMLFD